MTLKTIGEVRSEKREARSMHSPLAGSCVGGLGDGTEMRGSVSEDPEATCARAASSTLFWKSDTPTCRKRGHNLVAIKSGSGDNQGKIKEQSSRTTHPHTLIFRDFRTVTVFPLATTPNNSYFLAQLQ